MQDSKKKI